MLELNPVWIVTKVQSGVKVKVCHHCMQEAFVVSCKLVKELNSKRWVMVIILVR